jgi:transposase-like protein
MSESDKAVRRVRAATKKHFTSEEKIRIVLEGLRGQVSISELCRREGISAATYYKWSKDFLDAGKNGLTLSTRRDATTDEVRQLREENDSLKKAVADLMLDVIRYKKSLGL